MIGNPTTTIIGNLVNDPELRYTPSGKPVANFRIATTPRQFDKESGKYIDGQPLFITCNIWGTPAENLTNSLHKGDRIITTGTLNQRTWEDNNGSKRTTFELEADEVGPSLRFATTQVTKTTRGSSNTQQQRTTPRPQANDPWTTTPTNNNEEPPF